jgi:hypothetical protein
MTTSTTATKTATTYSATYEEVPCEGGIVTFLSHEELDQWFETFGCHCYSVIFH